MVDVRQSSWNVMKPPDPLRPDAVESRFHCVRRGAGRRPAGGQRTRYHRSVPVAGPLRMIQAFANTLGTSPGTDQLGTREEAAAWLRTAGLLPAEAGLSNS